MHSLGGAAVGQQSGCTAFLWEGSVIWTHVADEVDSFRMAVARHENFNRPT